MPQRETTSGTTTGTNGVGIRLHCSEMSIKEKRSLHWSTSSTLVLVLMTSTNDGPAERRPVSNSYGTTVAAIEGEYQQPIAEYTGRPPSTASTHEPPVVATGEGATGGTGRVPRRGVAKASSGTFGLVAEARARQCSRCLWLRMPRQARPRFVPSHDNGCTELNWYVNSNCY